MFGKPFFDQGSIVTALRQIQQTDQDTASRAFSVKHWVLVVVIGLWSATAFADTESSCHRLAGLTLSGTRITDAEIMETGFMLPASAFDQLQTFPPLKPRFCRVKGTITPAIRFEVWLPMKAAWNGKLQGIGNGGMAGVINYPGLRIAVARGYAGVSSDLGHQGGFVDSSWAIGHPELVRDWGYRATHEMTVKAKAIVSAYYSQSANYAYFTGCSGGGRQGLMEAQRFPGDYDGILAGDPTMDFTRLVSGGRLWQVLSNLDNEKRHNLLAASQVELISATVIDQCDALDGVSDGVLNDPRACPFDPTALICNSNRNQQCLTREQAAALRKIYRGSVTAGGETIYPGYLPGGELGRSGWVQYFAGDAPFNGLQWLYASGFLRGLVFENNSYDPLSFDYETDVTAMDNKMVLGESLASTINATDTDLDGFRTAGGKLIHYHGWNDPGVSALRSVQYYEQVKGRKDDFYRLFMVPGLQHCVGGPGANQFGASFLAPVSGDPSHNIFKALQAWVEQGVAPEQVIATKYRNDDPAQGVKFTRPLCPYPKKAVYRGSGIETSADSYRCQ